MIDFQLTLLDRINNKLVKSPHVKAVMFILGTVSKLEKKYKYYNIFLEIIIHYTSHFNRFLFWLPVSTVDGFFFDFDSLEHKILK